MNISLLQRHFCISNAVISKKDFTQLIDTFVKIKIVKNDVDSQYQEMISLQLPPYANDKFTQDHTKYMRLTKQYYQLYQTRPQDSNTKWEQELDLWNQEVTPYIEQISSLLKNLTRGCTGKIEDIIYTTAMMQKNLTHQQMQLMLPQTIQKICNYISEKKIDEVLYPDLYNYFLVIEKIKDICGIEFINDELSSVTNTNYISQLTLANNQTIIEFLAGENGKGGMYQNIKNPFQAQTTERDKEYKTILEELKQIVTNVKALKTIDITLNSIKEVESLKFDLQPITKAYAKIHEKFVAFYNTYVNDSRYRQRNSTLDFCYWPDEVNDPMYWQQNGTLDFEILPKKVMNIDFKSYKDYNEEYSTRITQIKIILSCYNIYGQIMISHYNIGEQIMNVENSTPASWIQCFVDIQKIRNAISKNTTHDSTVFPLVDSLDLKLEEQRESLLIQYLAHTQNWTDEQKRENYQNILDRCPCRSIEDVIKRLPAALPINTQEEKPITAPLNQTHESSTQPPVSSGEKTLLLSTDSHKNQPEESSTQPPVSSGEKTLLPSTDSHKNQPEESSTQPLAFSGEKTLLPSTDSSTCSNITVGIIIVLLVLLMMVVVFGVIFKNQKTKKHGFTNNE